ncbi:sulfatase-like hydrolase/transferase [Psychrobacillus sp. FSL H8-0510]|uniref:sulfatase-like hydrolase/transferase n=1 Tax=Psychrobacillus sp. FSL H8-0510 TaxID=2921394 RepID=UPI0030F57DC7
MSKSNENFSNSHHHNKRPNILFIIVDEERFPTVYETEAIKEWRVKNLKTQELLRKNGMTFSNHYIGSTACSPSRATLFTGQYPSLHGVTQTTGVAKGAFDPDVFWLDHSTVPTLGEYFRTAEYQTYWKGKWHLSDEDILIPGTHDALPSYNTKTGVPNSAQEQIYEKANRLSDYGFDGWIGPEPHGSNPRNSASSAGVGVSGRDEVYAKEVVDLIHSLEKNAKSPNDQPWLIVSSFVNPHDITLLGLFTRFNPSYNFEIDPTLPFVPPAPTANENLLTKPSVQLSYRDIYQQALQPTFDSLLYRQLYFSLQKKVDDEMYKVFQALQSSIFYEDTIIIFTADHGSLVGAHGGLFQKWHNAYEESVHVPLIIHSPKFSVPRETDIITSHLDIIPTLLGLANINAVDAQKELKKSHSEVHPLVGRDFSPLINGKTNFPRANEPIYFMTDDEVTKGLNQFTVTGKPYESVIQPNHLETIILKLPTGKEKTDEVWKLTRYFDNPQFWSDPGIEDKVTSQEDSTPVTDTKEVAICITTTKQTPVDDEYELYNVTRDPTEECNLAFHLNETPESKLIQKVLISILQEQSKQKRLSPTSGTVPGMPTCES